MPQIASESDRLRQVFRAYAGAGLPASKWSLRNRGNLAIQREIFSALAHLLAGAGIRSFEDRRALEIGCGDGRVLEQLIALGASPRLIAGIDLLEERVEAARRRLPEADLRVADARSLPFADESFDVVVAFTVFSSILELEFAGQVAREVCRVLKPGGVVVHYDFIYNNPWNSNVRGVKRAEIEGYFEGFWQNKAESRKQKAEIEPETAGGWKRQEHKAESRKQKAEIDQGPRTKGLRDSGTLLGKAESRKQKAEIEAEAAGGWKRQEHKAESRKQKAEIEPETAGGWKRQEHKAESRKRKAEIEAEAEGGWKRQEHKAESRKQKAEIEAEAAGGWKRLTLFPPLARRLGIFTPVLYPVLAAVPLLRTHLMGVLVKPGSGGVDGPELIVDSDA